MIPSSSDLNVKQKLALYALYTSSEHLTVRHLLYHRRPATSGGLLACLCFILVP